MVHQTSNRHMKAVLKNKSIISAYLVAKKSGISDL